MRLVRLQSSVLSGCFFFQILVSALNCLKIGIIIVHIDYLLDYRHKQILELVKKNLLRCSSEDNQCRYDLIISIALRYANIDLLKRKANNPPHA